MTGQPEKAPLECVGVPVVARWLGKSPDALTHAMARNPGWPEPDARTEGLSFRGLGWTHDRQAEWQTWQDRLPGQGARSDRAAARGQECST